MGDAELPRDVGGGQLGPGEQRKNAQADRVGQGAQRSIPQRHVGESRTGRVNRPTLVGEWQTARKGGILAKVTGE
ncbi:hypothetical protein L3i22_001150 [Actinoplanes sp. L3-i22]|nr:hypothetical protein L3i22_001150 [Actinoplanes sp. L3-i22]